MADFQYTVDEREKLKTTFGKRMELPDDFLEYVIMVTERRGVLYLKQFRDFPVLKEVCAGERDAGTLRSVAEIALSMFDAPGDEGMRAAILERHEKMLDERVKLEAIIATQKKPKTIRNNYLVDLADSYALTHPKLWEATTSSEHEGDLHRFLRAAAEPVFVLIGDKWLGDGQLSLILNEHRKDILLGHKKFWFD